MSRPVVEALDEARALVRALLLDDAALVRATLSGRQRNTTVPYRRVALRYVDLLAGRRLQVTSYDETQAHTRNVDIGAAAVGEVDSLLAQGYANWQVESGDETVQVRVSKKGRPLVHRAAAGATGGVPDRAHDRPKRRRLDETDELFAVLGITTPDGHIKPSRTAKFRQVQDFLAALDPLVSDLAGSGRGAELSTDRQLRVVDLGCGNAYLTFAALRYLSTVKQLSTNVVGIDVKAQARAHNEEVARRLGVAAQVHFLDSTIAGASVDLPPHLVLALHACDTATDDALARAVNWGAQVVMAAPCCHHDIQRQLTAADTPGPYRLVTRHKILAERLADVLTDAFRAAILRMVGYRVEVIEFVESMHTPRNTLIRAVRTGSPPSADTVAAYRSLVGQWGVQPALATLLAAEHPVLAGDHPAWAAEHPER